MKIFLLSVFFLLSLSGSHAVNGFQVVSDDCAVDGVRLYGKVKVVDSFADLKVQVVTAFPDLRVKLVDAFPDSCGEWQMVDSFPDFTIQIVDSFPDLKIQYVTAFPG
jgi:hypothetical protein